MTVAHYADDVEHDEQPTPETLLAATLALDAAISQLVEPGLERLDRTPQADPDVQALAAETARTAAQELARDHHREAQLLAQHAAAKARNDDIGDRRAKQIRRNIVALRLQMRALADQRERRAQALAATTAPLPSLLEQLLDAIGSSHLAANGAAGSAHRIPIDPKAVELAAEIQHAVVGQPGDNPTAQVRAWAEAIIEENNATTLPAAAQWAERWVVRARDIVTPTRIEEVSTEPCPRCGNLWVHTRDDTGEIVRKPALQVRRGRPTPTGHTAGGEIRCMWHSCGAYWKQIEWDWLAGLTAQKRQEREQAEQGRAG